MLCRIVKILPHFFLLLDKRAGQAAARGDILHGDFSLRLPCLGVVLGFIGGFSCHSTSPLTPAVQFQHCVYFPFPVSSVQTSGLLLKLFNPKSAEWKTNDP